MRIRSLVSLAALSLSAGQLMAQNSPQMSPAAAVPQWRSFIGANPLGIPFDIVSVEAETAISSGGTVGLVAAYNDFDDTRFTTFDLRGKYYPGEVAMRGFAVGLSLGTTKFNGFDYTRPGDPVTGEPPRATLQAPTLGVLVDYNWAQGPSQRFIVGTGIGAKRILASEEKRRPLDLERAYITGRFVIGLLF
ncbi:MAG TPA: hypothetical protein VFO55_01270 [Gemmatimonadaceae bacterium]|nr:hypothetical protein [Gemmatimonadaceae bacterium]